MPENSREVRWLRLAAELDSQWKDLLRWLGYARHAVAVSTLGFHYEHSHIPALPLGRCAHACSRSRGTESFLLRTGDFARSFGDCLRIRWRPLDRPGGGRRSAFGGLTSGGRVATYLFARW